MVGRHAMPRHSGPTGGNNFFLAEAYRCAFETELAKRIQKSRIGKNIFLQQIWKALKKISCFDTSGSLFVWYILPSGFLWRTEEEDRLHELGILVFEFHDWSYKLLVFEHWDPLHPSKNAMQFNFDHFPFLRSSIAMSRSWYDLLSV